MQASSSYCHTQHAPLARLLYGLAAAVAASAWLLPPEVPKILLLWPPVFLSVVAAGFHHLTVEDAGDRLLIAFGPLPLFRRSVRYEDVVGVEVGRSTVLEGWGIHLSHRGGWIWNIWGRDCVIVGLRRGRLTIGTDDAATLAEFLRGRSCADV